MAKAEMPPITALDAYTESINLLAYADPGAGKTALAGTSGEEGLIIATEPGTISAKRLGSKALTQRVTEYPQFAAILNALRKGRLVLPTTGKPPKWVSVDTLTELQQMLQRHIAKTAHEDSPQRDEHILDMRGHQDWQSTFKRIVHAMNDLPQNVLYTCHAMRDEDENGDPIILPDLSGKNGTNDSTTMSRWVSGTVHAYGYLKVKQGESGEYRRWLMTRSGPYFGKDRYGVLSPWVDNPNLLDIESRITASNEGTQ